MKRYFLLQWKRTAKLLPFLLILCLVILVGLGAAAAAFGANAAKGEQNQKFKVGVTGDWDNSYTKLGLAALQEFDDTRFSIEITPMDREEADRRLQQGSISAYVVFPENFIERALKGDVDKVTYVTTPGNQTVVSVFKEEMTKHITDMAVACQKGAYGVADAIQQWDVDASAGRHTDAMSLEMVTLILNRSSVYTLEEMGISTGVSLPQYYLCGISVLFLLLLGVCFVPVYVKNYTPLHTLLVSKGLGCMGQIAAEYAAYLLILLIPLLLLFGGITGAGALLPAFSQTVAVKGSFLVWLLPVTLMIAAFHLACFALSSDPVTGVLLSFLGCVGQGYVCGCFYPLYALPTPLQTLSSYLPCGVARELLEGSFTGEFPAPALIKALLFTLLFLGITLWVRKSRVTKKGR